MISNIPIGMKTHIAGKVHPSTAQNAKHPVATPKPSVPVVASEDLTVDHIPCEKIEETKEKLASLEKVLDKRLKQKYMLSAIFDGSLSTSNDELEKLIERSRKSLSKKLY